MYAEILDERGRPLPPGDAGELVVTTFGVEAMPLVRYRTGDVSFIETGPCPCGRTTPRLGPILGRRTQMIKLKGGPDLPGPGGRLHPRDAGGRELSDRSLHG